MKKYIATFKIDGNPGITNDEVETSKSAQLKHDVIEALEDGNAHFLQLADPDGNIETAKPLNESNTTYISILLPSHPENIKGSDGNVKKAAIIILESYNTDLRSIAIDGTTIKVVFEYTGEVHYTIEDKKPVSNYESYTFVAKGDYGIPKLSKAYKNELVRLCLEALNDKGTVLYERAKHTTDFDYALPEELEIPAFDHLVIQLNVPTGEVAFDEGSVDGITQDLHAEHFDINVFNAEGIFMPEKIIYDDGDGQKKLIVSLYYESNL
jgi:hypothetical protein